MANSSPDMKRVSTTAHAKPKAKPVMVSVLIVQGIALDAHGNRQRSKRHLAVDQIVFRPVGFGQFMALDAADNPDDFAARMFITSISVNLGLQVLSQTSSEPKYFLAKA